MRVGLFAVALTFTQPAFAQPYYGQFSDGPQGEFLVTEPWPEFVLSADFRFDDPNGLAWVTPSGTVVNGASIPKMFWSFIGGPFSGRYLQASVIHDHYVTIRVRTAHDTHRNFYYGMMANGVEPWQAKAMYWAVRTFGDDWDLPRPDNNAESFTGWGIAQSEELDNLASAVARQAVLEVARNLKTSEGETLRVTYGGPVEATLDAIDADAFNTQRTLFMTVPLLTSENAGAVLMMMSNYSGLVDSEELTFDTLPEWPEGNIPISGGAVAQDFRDTFRDDIILDFDFEVPG
jgi:hypothetical protein